MNEKVFLTAMMTRYRESNMASGVVALETPGINILTATALRHGLCVHYPRRSKRQKRPVNGND